MQPQLAVWGVPVNRLVRKRFDAGSLVVSRACRSSSEWLKNIKHTSKASSGGGGSGSLAGVQSTQVESQIADPAAEKETRRGADGKARRSTEDIQLVFDKYKGSIYSLYRRALRKNPALEGTVVLSMVIQPDGTVTKCEVVSSELNDADLERKIVLKVKRINFGAMDVGVWQDTYPISFIPS